MNSDNEITMSVSSVFMDEKTQERYAYVTFTDKDKKAEGKIPDCKIEKNSGFTEEEAELLEKYMTDNLYMLKKMASEINVMKAFMK